MSRHDLVDRFHKALKKKKKKKNPVAQLSVNTCPTAIKPSHSTGDQQHGNLE